VLLQIGFMLEEKLALRAVQATKTEGVALQRQPQRWLGSSSSPQRPRQSPRNHHPQQQIDTRTPVSPRGLEAVDEIKTSTRNHLTSARGLTTTHEVGCRALEVSHRVLDGTVRHSDIFVVTEEGVASAGQAEPLSRSAILMTPPESRQQRMGVESVVLTPVKEAPVTLEQLEEAKDRMVLDSLKQLSKGLDAKDACARKVAGRTVATVGVLYSTGNTPKEDAKEANRRHGFLPNPPLVTKRSVLFRQGGEPPPVPLNTPATPRTRAARAMQIEEMVAGSNRRSSTSDGTARTLQPTAPSRPQTGVAGKRSCDDAQVRPHTSSRGMCAPDFSRFAASGGSAKIELERNRRGARSVAQTPLDSRQTSWQSLWSMHPDEIVESAYVAAVGAHRPGVVSIYPSERLGTKSEEGPILQASKLRDFIEQRVRVQSSPGLLNLNNLVVDWTNWTVPDEICLRSDPINGRPKSSRVDVDSPLVQRVMNRSHSSHPALSAVSDGRSTRRIQPYETLSRAESGMDQPCRPRTDNPSNVRQNTIRGRNSVSSLRRPGADKTINHKTINPTTINPTASISSVQADNLRPQTSEGNNRLARASPASRGYAADVRPATSDGRQRVETAVTSHKSTKGWQDIRLTPSGRSAVDLWSDIVSEIDSIADVMSLGTTGVDKFERLGQQESLPSTPQATLDWIGTQNYRHYMNSMEDIVAETSEKDFLLAQDARIRKMLPQYGRRPGWRSKKPSSNAILMSVLKRTAGGILRTASTDTETSESSRSLKEMPNQELHHDPRVIYGSVKEAMEANKERKAQVIVDMENYLEEKMDGIKWGDREAPSSEGGLANLIDSMRRFDAKVPSKIDWIDNDMKPFLKSQMEEKKQQLLLEGRAHAAATMEESKSYISAFYSDSTERFTDNNAFATKNWEGMTRHEIMKHAEFLRELEYIKCKSNDLIERIARENRHSMKKSKQIGETATKEEQREKAKPKIKQVSSSSVVNKGFLRIRVHEADNLPKSESKHTADTYVRCEIRTERNEYARDDKAYVAGTDIVWDSFSPQWRKELEFAVPSGVDDITLHVSIYDVDLAGYGQQAADTWVGYVEIPIFSGGFQSLVAEAETTLWHTLLNADDQKISSNLPSALGRPSTLKLSHKFSRKERMSFSISAHLLQAAYRCHLARTGFRKQQSFIQGYRNSLGKIPEVVLKLEQEHYWEHYTHFCHEENTIALSECKRQFDMQVSFKLVHMYLSFRGVCALSRMFAEIYPPGNLRSLELVHTGINSPGIVALANAIRVGGTALNSLILTGNRITYETNDVAQANHPITNRLGRGLSGCRAVAQVIAEVTTLRRLSFESCKLGNQGLAEIAKALQTNRSVQFLDVSDTNEAQPVAMQTAATELGKMLAENDDLIEFHCHDVGFPGNSALAILGGGSFSKFGLRMNGMLRIVDLSRNNLCRTIYANEALRDFLCSDTCFLEHLDLGYNRMDQHGVLVFADGLIGNKSLHHVILDGNPLGVIGCRTLLSYRGRKTTIGVSTAGLSEEASVSSRRPKSKMQVRQIFEKFDKDHSGAMDVREMQDFLESLSNVDLGTSQSIIDAIDKDNSGAIEFDEFYAWYMKSLGIEDDGDKPLEIRYPCIHMCIFTSIHARAPMYIYTYTHTRMYIYIHTTMHMCKYVSYVQI